MSPRLPDARSPPVPTTECAPSAGWRAVYGAMAVGTGVESEPDRRREPTG